MLHGRKKGGGTKQGYKIKASYMHAIQVTPVSLPKQVKAGQKVIITITISQFLQTQAIIQRKHACCLAVLPPAVLVAHVLQCPMLNIH